jgi:hypothetical protein
MLHYREVTGKAAYVSTSAFDTLRNHLHVHNEDRTSTDDYLIDTTTHQCIRWIYDPQNKSEHVLVVSDGHALRLNGTHRNGKTTQRTITLGSAPWAQEWMSFLGAFALSKKAATTFCSLVPPTLDLAHFTATVLGEESMIIDGAMMPAMHVRVTFSGKLSIAWHGDYWFRSRDGRFVRFAGSVLPGFPDSIFELVDSNHGMPQPKQRRHHK